ncbi:hypothetical protein CTRI78_v004506 [Colletotrichum trifolii]|uniref:Uncharacterized protein n=1 Tax=Colletotrichum trifolii TaxID=5466 RepID=A0A4R8RGV3_COLTR|nr:hypothetical protein CTRI78_v004506 [Colletotrichum trifolii]
MSGSNYFKPAVSVVGTVAIFTVAWFVFKARPTTTGRRTGPRVTNGRPVDPEQGHPERPPLRRSSERRSRFREELTSSDEDSETRGLLHVRVNNSDEDSEARSLITEDVNSSGEDSETRRLIPEDVNNSDEDLSTIAEESDSGSSGRPSDQRVIDAGLENTKCLYPGCTIRGLDAINCRHGDTSGNGGSEDGVFETSLVAASDTSRPLLDDVDGASSLSDTCHPPQRTVVDPVVLDGTVLTPRIMLTPDATAMKGGGSIWVAVEVSAELSSLGIFAPEVYATGSGAAVTESARRRIEDQHGCFYDVDVDFIGRHVPRF